MEGEEWGGRRTHKRRDHVFNRRERSCFGSTFYRTTLINHILSKHYSSNILLVCQADILTL